MYINGLMISRSNFQFSNLRLFPRVERGAFSESIEILSVWRVVMKKNEEATERRRSVVESGIMLFEGGTIIPKWYWHNCSQVAWHWCNCFQVRLNRLFLSETGKIVPKCDWHSCSQVALAQLFSSDTGAAVAQLFPSDTNMIIPKLI